MHWRRLALLVFFVATWLGCASDDDGKPPSKAAGAAGQSLAGSGAGATGGQGGTPGVGGLAGAALSTGGSASGAGGVPAAWSCEFVAYGNGKCDCGCGVPDPDCGAPGLAACEVCNDFGSCNLAECPGRIDPDDVTQCVPPPSGWTCTPSFYGDGTSCECGCGIADPDCATSDSASCDNCRAMGACSRGPCPSAIAADDNTRCEVPARWTCSKETYGDGSCNCGCGVVDVDCADASVEACELCDDSSCAPTNCAVIADDNAHCADPPRTWNCSPRLYGDGTRCDCGCGTVDPDCTDASPEACDKCDAPGSCSAAACPGLISASSNARCDQPAAPPEWTCAGGAYADGLECDCGCGVPDPDCRSADFSACVRCLGCGGHGACEDTVDHSDTTECAPPPSDWTCSADAFRDQICDCGCGMLDLPCQGIELRYVCGKYPVEGCSGGNKLHIDPNHNAFCTVSIPDAWSCDRSYYDDGLCDCGCGAADLDCPRNDAAECEKCDDEGSCSTTACPGTIATDDTAHCAE